eukprot:1350001-Rhodomonas_salina.2
MSTLGLHSESPLRVSLSPCSESRPLSHLPPAHLPEPVLPTPIRLQRLESLLLNGLYYPCLPWPATGMLLRPWASVPASTVTWSPSLGAESGCCEPITTDASTSLGTLGWRLGFLVSEVAHKPRLELLHRTCLVPSIRWVSNRRIAAQQRGDCRRAELQIFPVSGHSTASVEAELTSSQFRASHRERVGRQQGCRLSVPDMA